MVDITFFAYPSPLVWWHLVLNQLARAFGAFIIGCFGMGGGVIYVPALLLLPGVNSSVAVPTSFFAGIFGASARFIQAYRSGRCNLQAWPLLIGAAPGAVAGQLLLPYIPTSIVALAVALICIRSGVMIQIKVAKEYAAQQSEKGMPKAQAGTSEAPPPELLSAIGMREVEAEHVNSGNMAAIASSDKTAAKQSTQCAAYWCLPCGTWTPQPQAKSQEQPEETSPTAASATSRKAEEPASSEKSPPAAFPSSPTCIATAFVAALLSSIGGVGGPLIFIPMWMQFAGSTPPKTLLAISTVFTFTITLCACVSGFFVGKVDAGLGLLSGFTSVVFVLVGGRCMELLGDSSLKCITGFALAALGAAVGIRALLSMLDA
ncbi:unnamed protein product [Symbiodinium sp. CCMP2592]|nr:unnamed protein product [Symbiodinium sp. CCMP2592]